jgi:hypothetical protein
MLFLWVYPVPVQSHEYDGIEKRESRPGQYRLCNLLSIGKANDEM